MTVLGVQREGDKTPGGYREGAVRIAQTEHLPPDGVLVPQYMQELVSFINRDDSPRVLQRQFKGLTLVRSDQLLS
ncbi:hypothetical protein PPUJ20066_46280 [Pseudomonas putida]|nr:hypothetical protein PPUJ20066_46280 [Pseudomonas putida]